MIGMNGSLRIDRTFLRGRFLGFIGARGGVDADLIGIFKAEGGGARGGLRGLRG